MKQSHLFLFLLASHHVQKVASSGDSSVENQAAITIGEDHPMSLFTRSLQEAEPIQQTSDWLGSNSVEAICEKYNANLTGLMTCTCARHGKTGKQISCSFDEEQCGGSVCYTATVTEFLTVDNDSRAKETCSRYNTTGDAETCILILPHVVGNYTLLERCEAKYSPSGLDALPCHSCSVCAQENDSVLAGTAGTMKVSLDCCNLKTDLKQTCSAVSDGLALPWFDDIQLSEEGQCVSGALGQPVGFGLGIVVVFISLVCGFLY